MQSAENIDCLWMGRTLTMHWHRSQAEQTTSAIMTLVLKKILTLEWKTVNRITRHGGQLSLAWLAAQYWDERHFQRATVQTQNTENQCPETSNKTQKLEKQLLTETQNLTQNWEKQCPEINTEPNTSLSKNDKWSIRTWIIHKT